MSFQGSAGLIEGGVIENLTTSCFFILFHSHGIMRVILVKKKFQ